MAVLMGRMSPWEPSPVSGTLVETPGVDVGVGAGAPELVLGTQERLG